MSSAKGIRCRRPCFPLTYVPDADFDGNDSFTVTIASAEGADPTPSTVSISMVGTSDAPALDPAAAGPVTATESTSTSIGAELMASFADLMLTTSVVSS